MKKRIILYYLLLFIIGSHPAYAKKSKCEFTEISHVDSHLIVDFRIHDFITKDLLDGLRKGMTAAIEFHVQLWRARRGWMDHLVAEENMRMRIIYDNWEKSFIVSTRDNEDQHMNESRLIQYCSEVNDYKLALLEKMTPGKRYYIGVRALLQPLSIENFEEIRRWLSGEVRNLNAKSIQSTRSPGKKAGNWLLGVVLNLTGFGDRLVQAKSPAFYLREGPRIEREEK